MNKSHADLLPGMLDMLILQTLTSGPLYGYAIAKSLFTTSKEVFGVEQGSLYPALFRMERKGWLTHFWGESETGRRVKFYRLTRSGRNQLKQRESAWMTFVEAVTNVMKG